MVTQRTVTVAPGVDLSVIARDARPDMRAFVLVHGLASNARLWDGVGDRLAELGHASIAVDQRGHGRSSKPDDGYDFETVADDLAAVIEKALGRPAVVAGQSWGGNVVVELARRHPDLVSGIVCVDGGFIQLADTFPVWADAVGSPGAAGLHRVHDGADGDDVEDEIRRLAPEWDRRPARQLRDGRRSRSSTPLSLQPHADPPSPVGAPARRGRR